jgi:hypothetical protein
VDRGRIGRVAQATFQFGHHAGVVAQPLVDRRELRRGLGGELLAHRIEAHGGDRRQLGGVGTGRHAAAAVLGARVDLLLARDGEPSEVGARGQQQSCCRVTVAGRGVDGAEAIDRAQRDLTAALELTELEVALGQPHDRRRFVAARAILEAEFEVGHRVLQQETTAVAALLREPQQSLASDQARRPQRWVVAQQFVGDRERAVGIGRDQFARRVQAGDLGGSRGGDAGAGGDDRGAPREGRWLHER